MRVDPTGGGAAVLGVFLLLSLFAIGVIRHPVSIESTGGRLVAINIGVVLTYGAAGIWVRGQRLTRVGIALSVGAAVGLALGAAHVANHVIESFVPLRGRMALVLGAGHMLLTLALFCVAGSIAWARTRSVGLSVVGGVWCAMLAVLMALAFAFTSNLAFEARAVLRLTDAFLASGMSDPGAFMVRNSFEAASEALVAMPALAVLPSLAGGLANAWMSGRSRRTAFAAALLMPVVFAAGALSLWYADSLERAARPPFVMTGLLLAGLSLAGLHPTWSALRRARPTNGAAAPLSGRSRGL